MPKLFPIIDALTPSPLTMAFVVMSAVVLFSLWKLLKTWRDHEAAKHAIARELHAVKAERYQR